ncbi:cytochrome b, partial [Rhizobium petrolearium]|uniref:cytochrome b/b6 domain-containing protein n=1 Tax=Neorhizobium petrolearium TaxID=515361 RepID=UPI001F1A6FD0
RPRRNSPSHSAKGSSATDGNGPQAQKIRQSPLVEIFGGRQSARTIHFITASALVIFVIVHVAMVVLSGTWNNIRSMITGRYAIQEKGPQS